MARRLMLLVAIACQGSATLAGSDGCDAAVQSSILVLQRNTSELAACVGGTPSSGNGAFCLSQEVRVLETPSLHPACAALERQRCIAVAGLNEAVRTCGKMLSDPGQRAALLEVLGAARLFMRRAGRFDDARRLVSVPADFIDAIARPLTEGAGIDARAEIARLVALTKPGHGGSSGDKWLANLADPAVAARCDEGPAACDGMAALSTGYLQAQDMLTAFSLSLDSFTLTLGKQTSADPGSSLVNADPKPAASTSDAVQDLLAAANARASASFAESTRAAASTIPDPESMRRGSGVANFAFGQMRAMLSVAQQMDSGRDGGLSTPRESAAILTADTTLAAAQLLTARDDASRREALNGLQLAASRIDDRSLRSANSALALGVIWLDSSTSPVTDEATRESFRRTAQDILNSTVMDSPALRGPGGAWDSRWPMQGSNVSGAGAGMPGQPSMMPGVPGVGGDIGDRDRAGSTLGGAGGPAAPKPPGSSLDASGCPNDMKWLMQHVRSPEARDPALYLSIDQLVSAAGGLDRGILLLRAQLREYQESYDVNRANVELRQAFPDEYRRAMTAIEDGIVVNRAHLEAMECRRRAMSGAP